MYDSFVWELVDVVKLFFFCGVYVGCCGGDGRVVIFGGIGIELNRFCDIWVLDLVEFFFIWYEVIILVFLFVWLGYIMIWIGGRRMIFFGG